MKIHENLKSDENIPKSYPQKKSTITLPLFDKSICMTEASYDPMFWASSYCASH